LRVRADETRHLASRLIHASAKEKFLPDLFARLSHHRRTPDNAMFLQASLTTFFVVFGGGFRSKSSQPFEPLLVLMIIFSIVELLLGNILGILSSHSFGFTGLESQGAEFGKTLQSVHYHANNLLRSEVTTMFVF
jgi:amino acid transporter